MYRCILFVVALVTFRTATAQTYTLTVSPFPADGGTVTGSGTFVEGSQQTVTATANPGYSFINWTENAIEVSTVTNYTFTLTTNRALVASFAATLTNVLDMDPPTLQVTQPYASDSFVVTTNSIVLGGFASDLGHGNNGISSVTVNGIEAIGGTVADGGTANWSLAVSLLLGTNELTIVATDGSTNANFTTRTLLIDYQVLPPVASFIADVTDGVAPLTVNFTDQSIGPITNRLWDFGDGSTGDEINPSRTYVTAGSFQVSLTVFGPGGSDTLSQPDFITVAPTVAQPTITPNGGSFQGSVEVTLDCVTPDTAIYYTLDASDPTSNSTPYSLPFTLTNSATVKAKGFKTGYNDSPVAASSFTITSIETMPPANPINAVIPKTIFALRVVDVIRIPDSGSGADRFARLEQLGPSGDGSGRLFVIDQRGKMFYFSVGETTPHLYFDFATNVPNFRSVNLSQSGLRSFAFHPDAFLSDTPGYRKLYIAYETDSTGNGEDHNSVVAEWTLDDSEQIIPDSRREILTQPQPRSDHNIGKLGFNPNVNPGQLDYGKLYISFGDGGEYSTRFGDSILNPNGQIRSNFLGTILRIDPLPSGTNAYTIPFDNPFIGEGADVKEEIWAYGLRNPHQFAWDTGGDQQMWIVDLGQDNIEEVNWGAAGANYGWPLREGTYDVEGKLPVSPMAVDTLPADHATDLYTYPVAQYDHDINNDGVKDNGAIAGGFVYRGSSVPELFGKYLFANFGNDANGPIYVVDENEVVQRDDFTNLTNLNSGFLAQIEELRLVDVNDNPTSIFDLVQAARAAAGVTNANTRTDIRFGDGQDGDVYILTKRDGWVRRLRSVLLAAGSELRIYEAHWEPLTRTFSFQWDTEPGKNYVIQASSGDSTGWTNVTEIVGDGELGQFNQEIMESKTTLFRIRVD